MVDPFWRTCTPAFYGVLDPPPTVRTATLIASTSPPAAISNTASPGAHIGPAYAPATSTATPENDTPALASSSDQKRSDRGETTSPSRVPQGDDPDKNDVSTPKGTKILTTSGSSQGLSANSNTAQDLSYSTSSVPLGDNISEIPQHGGGNSNENFHYISSNNNRRPGEAADNGSNSDPKNDPISSQLNNNDPHETVNPPSSSIADHETHHSVTAGAEAQIAPSGNLVSAGLSTVIVDGESHTLTSNTGAAPPVTHASETADGGIGQAIMAGLGNGTGGMVFTGERSRVQDKAWVRSLGVFELGVVVAVEVVR